MQIVNPSKICSWKSVEKRAKEQDSYLEGLNDDSRTNTFEEFLERGQY